MAYKNKTYVAFHYGEKGNMKDGDKKYYYLMEAWRDSDHIDFDFYDAHDITNLMATSNNETIKASLQERLRNTKVMVFLMGEKSKTRPWVVWELEQAISRKIPIVIVDVTRDSHEWNSRLIPDSLKADYPVAYTYFEKDRIKKAIAEWPSKHPTADGSKFTKF